MWVFANHSNADWQLFDRYTPIPLTLTGNSQINCCHEYSITAARRAFRSSADGRFSRTLRLSMRLKLPRSSTTVTSDSAVAGALRCSSADDGGGGGGDCSTTPILSGSGATSCDDFTGGDDSAFAFRRVTSRLPMAVAVTVSPSLSNESINQPSVRPL